MMMTPSRRVIRATPVLIAGEHRLASPHLNSQQQQQQLIQRIQQSSGRQVGVTSRRIIIGVTQYVQRRMQ